MINLKEVEKNEEEEFIEEMKRVEISRDINKEKAQAILTEYLRPFYESHGNKWNKDNDEDMASLVEAISEVALCDSLIELSTVFTHTEESE